MLVWRRRVHPLTNWKTTAFLTALLGLFIPEFGDKSQFIIATRAANTELWAIAIFGGFAGIMAANIPAVILRERLVQIVALKPIRRVSGVLLLGWGLVVAFRAFGIP